MTRVLAVIPARGGSKGLPGKNTRSLAGVPLIGYAIDTARHTPTVTRAVVSTDDLEISRVARSLGGDVPFLRPADLARDDTPSAPVVRHALAMVEQQEGNAYDAVLLLEPTSPLRDPVKIENAFRLLWTRPDCDGVVSVSTPTFDPLWVGVKALPDGTMGRYFPEAEGIIRRQDNRRRYLRVNGSFYIWRSDFVRRLDRSWLDEGRFLPFEIPESEAFSIDDAEELRILEAVMASGGIRHRGTDPLIG